MKKLRKRYSVVYIIIRVFVHRLKYCLSTAALKVSKTKTEESINLNINCRQSKTLIHILYLLGWSRNHFLFGSIL